MWNFTAGFPTKTTVLFNRQVAFFIHSYFSPLVPISGVKINPHLGGGILP